MFYAFLSCSSPQVVDFPPIEVSGQIRPQHCKDVDRPDECILHFWGEGVKPMALFCNRQTQSDGSDLLTPLVQFLVGDKGGIFPTVVAEADRDKFSRTRATLQNAQDGSYNGRWFDGSGDGGEIRLTAVAATTHISATECNTWSEFMAWSNTMRKTKNTTYFRGHGSNQFKLETSLQRSGRYRLERYCAETLNKFHRHAEAALKIRIDMSNGDDYGMLLGLAQHFGLPTPLLDWTASPYVAAFFAFSDALENRKARPDDTKVRIYALSDAYVRANRPNSVVLNFFMPYVSPLELSFRNNERLYAQQGCFIVTNHSDMEGMVHAYDTKRGTESLFAADLPVALAVEALQDLAFMGLTGATLFPGLEGVSRMLKHEMAFGHTATATASQPVQDAPPAQDEEPAQEADVASSQ
ncbi:hypothetical protein CSQ96_26805 [Janthinobacterium sp. BJB412]|nr:hypothetical protein CSQ96_26805 [Janthinobacterium sp. BJB412]